VEEPPGSTETDDGGQHRRIRALEANAREAYQAVEELAGSLGAQRCDARERKRERESHTAMEKLRIVMVGISVGRSLRRPFRDARRFPSTRL
jgi:hypothetical protein